MKRSLARFLLAIAAALPAFGADAQPAHMVKNVRPDPTAGLVSKPHAFMEREGIAYFTADDGFDSRGLWRTDGSPEGTWMLVNFGQYSLDSEYLTLFKGDLYFSGGDWRLWKTDGSPQGTAMLGSLRGPRAGHPLEPYLLGETLCFTVGQSTLVGAEIEIGRTDGTPSGSFLLTGSGTTGPELTRQVFGVANGKIFFLGSEDDFGDELWASDGSTAGTARMGDFIAGPIGSLQSLMPQQSLVFGEHLFLAMGSDAAGWEPWVSDGTSAGTIQLADISPGIGHSFPQGFTPLGGAVYFVAGGSALWRTDGTPAGTSEVASLGISGGLDWIEEVSGRLVFFRSFFEGGIEIWVSDGTAAGTMKLDLPSSSEPIFGRRTKFGGRIYFSAEDANGLGRELYVSDGTVAGTGLFKDLESGSDDSNPRDMFVAASSFFFTTSSGTSGTALWKSDGTSEGTIRLATLSQYPAFSSVSRLIGEIGGRAFIQVCSTYTSSDGIWSTDGSEAGTFEIPGTGCTDGAVAAGTLYYQAGGELWATDGSPQGSRLVKDIATNDSLTRPHSLAALNGRLLFSAGDGVHGRELWRSDGTEAGTTLLKDIDPAGSSSPSGIVSIGGKAFFAASLAETGPELWSTDGTPEGTAMVADLEPGPVGSAPEGFAPFLGEIYFSAYSAPGIGARQLWRTDGTAEGTRLAPDIPDPLVFSRLGESAGIASAGGLIYFIGGSGSEEGLWVSDGAAGSARHIGPSLTVDSVRLLTTVGPAVYFVHRDQELWRSDGTDGGTALVSSFPGMSHFISSMAVANDTLYFDMAGETVSLWRTDGATEGTVEAVPIDMKGGGDIPLSIRAFNDGKTLAFGAFNAMRGQEWWVSAGTPDTTMLAQEIAPFALSSRPHDFTVAGENLFFVANDGANGFEIWAAPLASVAAPVFTREPASQSANVGQKIEFWAEAAGAAPISLEWEKDGALLPGAAGLILPLDNIALADAGRYSCRATGPNGIAARSRPATLTVSYPPLPNLATLLGESVPERMEAGSQVYASVSMKNTSGLSWSRPQGYALAVVSDVGGLLEGATRVDLPEPPLLVPGGGAHDFILSVKAPTAPGLYALELRMAEGAASFGQSVALEVEVIEPVNALRDWAGYE